MERNDILSVAIDTIKHKADAKYSQSQTSEELRAALIEMNSGSTKLNAKTFRPGSDLYELVQEIIPVAIEEGIKAEDNPLFDLVEYRNLKDGDTPEFDIEGDANFVVATAANGIQGVRRQRITGGQTVTIPAVMKIVRVYENLGRLLAGRIDFNKFIDGVAKAFKNHVNECAYNAINGLSAATEGLDATYVISGTYSEDKLLALVEHVEAATGKAARIIGTKTALRKLNVAQSTSDHYKDDMYELGHYGRWNGVDVLCMKQAHKPGTNTFALNDNKVWVVAADDRPIKVVNVGDGLLIEHNESENADLTREYVYGQGLAVGVAVAAKLGVATLS